MTKYEIENLQIDNKQSSWWNSWSGLSQTFSNSRKGGKRNWRESSCDQEEENWWGSFQSSQKSTQKSSQESNSFQKESSKNEDNKQGATGGDEDDNDDIEVEFYVKYAKNEKFKYYWSFFYF